MPAVYEAERIVDKNDIDRLGHVNNLSYMQWAVDAAVGHSEANGWPFERYQSIGAGWVVRSHVITYLRPAFEGDRVIVRTWIAERARATCRRVYAIERVESEGRVRLADAHTDWVFVDFARQVPRRIPQEVVSSFPVTIPEGDAP